MFLFIDDAIFQYGDEEAYLMILTKRIHHTHTHIHEQIKEFCAILPSSDTNKDYLCDSHTKIRSLILYKI